MKARDCAIYYASQAAENKVALFTIGLLPGSSPQLLTAMATGTDPEPVANNDRLYFEQSCGAYFAVGNPNDLETIFDQILVLARNCQVEKLRE